MGETLDYQRDTERKKYFVAECKEHDAKLELRTFKWLVEKYSKPGDTILDPMSGIGTVHFAATMGRHTIAVEIAPRFVEIQHMNIRRLEETLGLTGRTMVLEMDCRRALPLPVGTVDLVIFSPPYSSVEKHGQTHGFREESGELMNVGTLGYSDQQANIGNLTVYPLYLEAMRHVYIACNRSLVLSQRLISVTKDMVKGGERVYIGKDNIRICMEAGFQLEDWHLRRTPRGIRQIVPQRRRQEKGTDRPELNISTEDLLVFRKAREV